MLNLASMTQGGGTGKKEKEREYNNVKPTYDCTYMYVHTPHIHISIPKYFRRPNLLSTLLLLT